MKRDSGITDHYGPNHFKMYTHIAQIEELKKKISTTFFVIYLIIFKPNVQMKVRQSAVAQSRSSYPSLLYMSDLIS